MEAIGTDHERRFVVHRRHGDGERRRGAGVVATIGGPAVVGEADGDLRGSGRVRRRGVGQGAGGVDRRRGREERRIVVGHAERDDLRDLVGWPRRDRAGPSGDRLGTGIFENEVIPAGGERGCVVHRGDGDCDGGGFRVESAVIGDSVGPRVGPDIVGIRDVIEGAVGVARHRAVGGCIHDGHARRLHRAIDIDVVGDDRAGRERGVLQGREASATVVDGDRRVVAGADRDRHLGRRRGGAAGIGDRVGEGVEARGVRIGRVVECPVAVGRHRAVRWWGDDGQRRRIDRIVDVGVVDRDRSGAEGRVLFGCEPIAGVIDRGRRVVDGRDRDPHRCSDGLSTFVVGDRVGEQVRAGDVVVGHIGERAVAVCRGGARRWWRGDACAAVQHCAVGVGVVARDVGGDEDGVLGGRVARTVIAVRDRCDVGSGRNVERDRRDRAPVGRVACAVPDRRGADEVRIQGVAHDVAVDCGGDVGRRADARDGEGLAVAVGVVGEQRRSGDGARFVLDRVEPVVPGLGRIGCGGDLDGRIGSIAQPPGITGLVGEGHGAGPVERRFVGDPVVADRGRQVLTALDRHDREFVAVRVGVVREQFGEGDRRCDVLRAGDTIVVDVGRRWRQRSGAHGELHRALFADVVLAHLVDQRVGTCESVVGVVLE